MSSARALASLFMGGVAPPSVQHEALAASQRFGQRQTLVADSYPSAPLETSQDPFEHKVLTAIAKTGHGLKFNKRSAIVISATRHGYGTDSRTVTHYRLESPELQASVEFELVPREGGRPGTRAHIVILHIGPARQGSFFRCRRFLDEVCAVLLEASGLHSLFGKADVNEWPIRQKREWRNKATKDRQTNKLFRLYQRCGAIPTPSFPGYVSLYSTAALAELECDRTPQAKALLAQKRRFQRMPRSKSVCPPQVTLDFCI